MTSAARLKGEVRVQSLTQQGADNRSDGKDRGEKDQRRHPCGRRPLRQR